MSRETRSVLQALQFMCAFFLARDIRDRIEALNGDNTQLVSLTDLLTWGAIGLAVVGLVYLVCRVFFAASQSSEPTNRRGHRRVGFHEDEAGDYVEHKDDLNEDHREDNENIVLGDLKIGTRVALFWDVGGMRCGCMGHVDDVEEGRVSVTFDTESAPGKGHALLVCPEKQGHVTFHQVLVTESPDGRTRIFSPATLRGASRMNKRYRSHVNLQAAMMKVLPSGREEEAMVARVHDLAFDGLGVLSEARLSEGDTVIIRLDLPGYLERLTLDGEVAWVQKDVAELYRAGIALDFDVIETRLSLADYMFGRLKAESSAIIMARRREANAPRKPDPKPEPEPDAEPAS